MPCIYSCILLSKPEAHSLLGFELLLIVEKLFPIIMFKRLADIWHRCQSSKVFLFCSWCIHDSWKCYLYVVVVTDTSYGEKRAIIHKYCPLFHLSLTCVCILNYTVTWLFTFLYSVDFMILVIYGCRMKDRMISSAFESRWEMGAQFYNMHESIERCCNPFFIHFWYQKQSQCCSPVEGI